jgi:exodeoxyribonuclease VII large subunit
MTRAMRARWTEDLVLIRALRARLSDPRFVIAQHQQGLDEQRRRAERAMGRRLAQSTANVEALERRLLSRHPRVTVLSARARLAPLAARLTVVLRRRLERERSRVGAAPDQLSSAMTAQLRRDQSRLEALRGRLLALSPLTVLRRGYSIVTTENGRVITDARAVLSGEVVRIRLSDGRLSARVEHSEKDGQ